MALNLTTPIERTETVNALVIEWVTIHRDLSRVICCYKELPAGEIKEVEFSQPQLDALAAASIDYLDVWHSTIEKAYGTFDTYILMINESSMVLLPSVTPIDTTGLESLLSQCGAITGVNVYDVTNLAIYSLLGEGVIV